MKVKKHLILLLSFLLVLIFPIKAEAAREKVLFIGDSRVYGMSLFCDDKDKYHFFCEGGVQVTFINNNLKATLGKVMPDAVTNTLTKSESGTVNLKKAIKDKGIKTIIYALGVNGCGTTGAGSDTAIKTIQKLEKETGCKVYFMSLLPMDSDKFSKDSPDNGGIDKFNKKVKKKVTNYIDANAHVKSIKNWKNHTSDGLHFDKAVYNKVLKYAVKEIESGGSDDASSDAKPKASKKEQKAAQKALGLSDDQVKSIRACWQSYLTSGWSEAAVAGALGNIKAESGFNPELVEKGADNPGIGLAQWTTAEEKKRLADWSKKCGHTTKNLAGYDVCVDLGCQFAFMVQDITDSTYGGASETICKYDEYVQDFKGHDKFTHSDPKDLKYDKIDVYKNLKNYKKAKSAWDAAMAFHDCYERSAGVNYYYKRDMNRVTPNTSGWIDGDFFTAQHVFRPKYAENALTLFGTGGSGSENEEVDKDTAQTIAGVLAANGYWTEEQLSSYCKLTEINVNEILKDATRDSLEQEELTDIVNWERNVDKDLEKSGLIRSLRIATSFLGIILTIWSVLIYIAFWFDRLNNIIDIQLLNILTFGKLFASENNKDATFSVSVNRGDKVSVSHMNIILISLVGLGFGSLLISGVIYRFIAGIVNFVLRILG